MSQKKKVKVKQNLLKTALMNSIKNNIDPVERFLNDLKVFTEMCFLYSNTNNRQAVRKLAINLSNILQRNGRQVSNEESEGDNELWKETIQKSLGKFKLRAMTLSVESTVASEILDALVQFRNEDPNFSDESLSPPLNPD